MGTENKNKISFVVPAYNCKYTISDTIYSIIDTNLKKGDEIIVVEDCSTDNTKEIIQWLYKKYYPNIKIIFNKENIGCPASRNVGIRQAKNKLIFNLDSDNVLAPNSIDILRQEISNNNYDVVAFSEYKFFKHDTNKITHSWICSPGILTLADFLSGILNPGPGGNFMFKKEIWEKVGGYWEYGKGLHEAWGFSLKLLINGCKFYTVPNTFYFHRYSHKSLFVRENKNVNEEITITNKFLENFINLLENGSQEYVKQTPNWFSKLNNHPLVLKDHSVGKNGKIVNHAIINKMKSFIHEIID